MLIYLCATPLALGACLRQLESPQPWGLLSAGYADLPVDAPALDIAVRLSPRAPHAALGAPIASALAELHPCRVIVADVGNDAGVDDLRTLRAVVQQLDGWDGVLVAGPRAAPLLGALEDDPGHKPLVPETLIVAALRAAPDIAWLLRPEAPQRFLAFDGNVYVSYDPARRLLQVYGDGSVLAVKLKKSKRSNSDAAQASVLTPGMSLTW